VAVVAIVSNDSAALAATEVVANVPPPLLLPSPLDAGDEVDVAASDTGCSETKFGENVGKVTTGSGTAGDIVIPPIVSVSTCTGKETDSGTCMVS
jgi:hypothetical protein